MSQGLIIRPIEEKDLAAISRFGRLTGPGFNSLPDSPDILKKKIEVSINSFSGKIEIKQRYYFFVMEDVEKQEVVGTCAIETCIGHPWPLYQYKLSTIVQVSNSQNKYRSHKILNLVSQHQDISELSSLYLSPAYRGEGRGAFLSRARCLFIAEFPSFFSNFILSDIRGWSDENGISPFWEALGKQFFDMSYNEASFLRSTQGSQFIVELMPHYPIYVDLLPEMVQNIIGKPHANAEPAMHVLEKEGLQFRKTIDIFDGGPTIEAPTLSVKTIRESQASVIRACNQKIQEGTLMLVSNTKLDFRAALGFLSLMPEGDVLLDADLAKNLNVAVGDRIRFCRFR